MKLFVLKDLKGTPMAKIAKASVMTFASLFQKVKRDVQKRRK